VLPTPIAVPVATFGVGDPGVGYTGAGLAVGATTGAVLGDAAGAPYAPPVALPHAAANRAAAARPPEKTNFELISNAS